MRPVVVWTDEGSTFVAKMQAVITPVAGDWLTGLPDDQC